MSKHIDLSKADLSRVREVPRDKLPPTLRRHEAMFLGPVSEPTLDKVLATGRVKMSKIGSTVIINTVSFLQMLDEGIANLSTAKTPRRRKLATNPLPERAYKHQNTPV